MKKLFLLLIGLIIFTTSAGVCAEYGIDALDLRPPKTVSIPKGAYVKLTNLKEFSSQFVDEGDEVVLASTSDVYIGETKIIPQNSKFYGVIEKLREPIQGTNAAITIKINKFVTPEGISYNINGYLVSSSGEMFLGGERTAPLYYVRMPHYTKWQLTRWWRIGAIQYSESNTRMYGVHTVVKAGAEILMVLQDNFDLVQY